MSQNSNDLTKHVTYVAIPYSYNVPIPFVTEEEYKDNSFRIASAHGAVLCEQDEIVFSPISNSHPMHVAGYLPHTWDYWEQADKFWLSQCSKISVIDNGHVDKSIGVKSELSYALELDLMEEPHVMQDPICIKFKWDQANDVVWESYIGTIIVIDGTRKVSSTPVQSTKTNWSIYDIIEAAEVFSTYINDIVFEAGFCFVLLEGGG